MRVFIIGCGRVGMGLMRLFTNAGINVVGGSCNTEEGAAAARKQSTAPIQVSALPEVPPNTDIVWFTTPDDVIATCAERLWQQGRLESTMTLVHASGALPAMILRENAPGVASVARAHPLQSFPPVEHETNVGEKAHWFLEGEDEGCQRVQDLLTAGGAATHLLPTEGGMAYHTAASLASNGLIALASVAAKMAQSAGISKTESLQIFLPLMRGTLDNLENVGLPNALTGPVARGDGDVVKAHIETLEHSAPSIAMIYRALAQELVAIATDQGRLDSDEIQALKQIVEE